MGEVIDRQDAYIWSISRIAEAFRMDRRTVTKRLQDAGVTPAGKKRGNPVYSLADAGPALYQERGEVGGGLDLDQFPDMRKAWYQSENERLKYEKEIRRLIPDDEFARELSTLAKTVAAGLDSLPDMLERDAGLSPEALERVQATIDTLREQMYQAAVTDAEGDDHE
ncbi:DUF1441 family protein [Modicisalibacter luteus]|uniref:DUF1441 family protein n=3 Tax=Modicisalibacter luteus TaxID=453962 RepID=A0ABV7M3T3_9GAMM|nr:DUF1441 family protein [Halomonas lutea]GHA85364.1 hypothetical protein GCM10007159_03080 [Halomonas lutea]